jgi:hypothetical protein
MVTDFFHINYAPRESWVLPIMARVQQSPSATLRGRWIAATSALAELPLALATKFEILGVLLNRLDSHINELSQDFDRRADEVEECITAKAAFFPAKKNLAFELVADLDAFLFEFRSAYEVLKTFVKTFSDRILDVKVNNEAVLKAILEKGGCNTAWIDFLNDERNLFIHQTAPWFAIEVTGQTPVRYELLILKRNTHDLEDPNGYARFDQYRAVYQGFIGTMQGLHRWLIREIEHVETRHP